MKKITVLVVFIVVSVAMFAHPPKKVVVKYDKEKGKLLIEAPHKVKDVEKHLINKLIVTVNDNESREFTYEKQSSLQTAMIELDLPGLKTGDIVVVKAKCNKSGAKSGKVTIE